MSVTTTLAEQAAAFRELEEHAAALKAEHSEAKALADEAEIRLFARMEHERVKALNHDEVGINFVRAETVYGQIQDESEFIKWAEGHAPELIEQKPRKKLINELARQHVDDGKPLPPGLGFYVDQYVSQRASQS